MVNEFERDDNIDVKDAQAKPDDTNSKEDQASFDDLDSLKLEFLDRSAPIADARRSDSIQDIRERVATSKRTILIGDHKNEKRIAIQRNGVRLVTFTIDNSAGRTDDQLREWVRNKIRRGDFDQQITTLYRELWAKLKH